MARLELNPTSWQAAYINGTVGDLVRGDVVRLGVSLETKTLAALNGAGQVLPMVVAGIDGDVFGAGRLTPIARSRSEVTLRVTETVGGGGILETSGRLRWHAPTTVKPIPEGLSDTH